MNQKLNSNNSKKTKEKLLKFLAIYEKTTQIILGSIPILVSGILFFYNPTIKSGLTCFLCILVLFVILNTDNINKLLKSSPKLGAIFTNFFVCLICGVFITSGIIIIIKYNNNNVLNNVLTFIFFICFPVLLGVLLLYASNQYYANQSKKIKLDKKVINKK